MSFLKGDDKIFRNKTAMGMVAGQQFIVKMNRILKKRSPKKVSHKTN